jgi:Ran GTPase-activating protein (RanGAP) involved in mRNA processing and transport
MRHALGKEVSLMFSFCHIDKVLKYVLCVLIGLFLRIEGIPPHDPPLEVGSELFNLREQLIVSVKAEQDVVTWVKQIKREGSSASASFLERLQPPESFFKEGGSQQEGEEALSELITELSQPSSLPFERPYCEALKTYYQTYLTALQGATTPDAKASLLEPKVIIQSEMMGPYRISQAMAYEMLSTNQYGDVVRRDHGGSHPVNKVGGLFFKRAVRYTDPGFESLPLQPAMESALYHGYRLLFGEGYLAPTTLLTFCNVTTQTPVLEKSQGLTPRQKEIIGNNVASLQLESYLRGKEMVRQRVVFEQQPRTYVAQASLAIEGRALHEYVEASPDQVPSFEERSFSAHVLGSYLFPTQDAKFDNFMVTPTEEGKQKIIGIDNDLALGPALKEGEVLNLKNGLYLYEGMMNRSIDAGVRYFITETPVEPFLLQWLKKLEELDEAYQNLQRQGCLSPEEAAFNGLPFTLSSSQLRRVGKNLLTLQSLLKETFYAQRLTHQQLLRILYPRVESFYADLQRQAPSPGDFMQFQMDTIFRGDHTVAHLPAQRGSIYPSLEKEKDFEETARKPVTDIIQEVIETSISYEKTEEQWGETLYLILELFPYQGIPIIKSLLKKNPSLKRLGESSEFVLHSLKKGHTANSLKLALQFLGFNLTNHTQEVLFGVIDLLPEDTGREWLNLLKGYHVHLETVDKETHETPLDRAMCLKKHGYVQWLIQNGAGHRVNLHSALQYIESLSEEERDGFDRVLPILEHRNKRLRWELMLRTFLPKKRRSSNIEGLDLQSADGKKRILSYELAAQLWDNPHDRTGFKRINTYGRRGVARLQQGRYHLYVKEHPELPGIEEAVGTFTRALIGHGAPYTLLTRIGNTAYLFTEGIEGENFQNYFKKGEGGEYLWPHVQDKIDPYSFSGMALVAMLINPEDGKPDNYILQEQEEGLYRLIGIDNDHAFVPSVAPVKWYERQIHRVQVKSVLFAMDQMKQPLHPRLRDQFLYHDPVEVLSTWIQRLSGVKFSYEALFNAREVKKYFKETHSFMGMALLPSTIHTLYRRLVDLQTLIERHEQLTLLEILRQFNTPLYERYERGFREYPTLDPYDRFLKLDGGDYTIDRRTKSLMTTRHAQQLLSSVQIDGKTLLEYVEQGRHEEIAPEVALEKLKAIAVKDTRKMVRQIVERGGGAAVDFEDMTDVQKEDFFKRLDWSKLPFGGQQALLRQLTTTPFRGHLTFKNCRALTPSLMAKLSWAGIESVSFVAETERTFNVLRKALAKLPKDQSICLDLRKIDILTDEVLDALIKDRPVKELVLDHCLQIEDPELRQKVPGLIWSDWAQLRGSLKNKLRGGFIDKKANLDLSNNNIGDEGAQAVAAVLRGSPVQQLGLGYNKIGAAGAKALADVLRGSPVQQLDLMDNKIGAAGAKALAAVLRGSPVQQLGLGYNKIGAAGVQALASGLKGSSVQHLDLSGNNIGDEGAKGLTAGLKESRVQHLDLVGNNIGAEGAQAFAVGLKRSQVQQLDLSSNNIGDKGVKVLARVLKESSVQQLDLRFNGIGVEGVKALAARLKGSGVQHLDLRSNNIGAEGAQALAAVLKGSAIQYLDLGGNNIGDKGVKVLARVLKDSSVQHLDLQWNNIGAEGAQALAAVLKDSSVQHLDLQWNNIGAEGAKVLTAGLKGSGVQHLNLYNNNIGDAGAQALAAVLKDSSVQHLDLWNNQISSDLQREIDTILSENKRLARELSDSPTQQERGVSALPTPQGDDDDEEHTLEVTDQHDFPQSSIPKGVPLNSWEKARYMLLEDGVDYQSILETLEPDLLAHAEAFEVCLQNVVPFYPEAYLKVADAVEEHSQKLYYIQKALEIGVQSALPKLETLYEETRNEQALLLMASVYRGDEYSAFKKEYETAQTLYQEGIERYDSADCRYQLATLYLEEEGCGEETLQKIEPLLQEAMDQGHGLAHLLWKELQSKQDRLMSSQEVSSSIRDQLREDQDVLRALYAQQYEPEKKLFTFLQKKGRVNSDSLEEVIAPYQAKEEHLRKEINSLKEEITTLSSLHPHSKRLRQMLMNLEQQLDVHTQRKVNAIERAVLGAGVHYDDLLKKRQYRFYGALYKYLTDSLMHGRNNIDIFLNLMRKQLHEMPGASFEKRRDDEVIPAIVAAIYSYRLQEFVPFLTEASQERLARALGMNFIHFMEEKTEEDSIQDVALILSHSFYHQRGTLGERLNSLLGRSDTLMTLYQEKIALKEIYRSGVLATRDGAEWFFDNRGQGDLLKIHNTDVRYHIPYSEMVYLKQQGHPLQQRTLSSLSALQREIALPQDSERYFEKALRFAQTLKTIGESHA